MFWIIPDRRAVTNAFLQRAGVLLSLLMITRGLAAEPVPLPHAHAHNDYEHRRPLLDALDQGFCSVEADIWLVQGRLLVAHNRSAVKPERTLQALYLDPLRERDKTNGNRIFPEVPSLTLLVDVKSDAGRTYEVLRKVLGDYRQILTE